MATTKKVVKIVLNLTDGQTKTITLNAEPVSNNLTDPETGDALLPDASRAILPVYESDGGVKAASLSYYIITTTTQPILEDYTPD